MIPGALPDELTRYCVRIGRQVRRLEETWPTYDQRRILVEVWRLGWLCAECIAWARREAAGKVRTE